MTLSIETRSFLYNYTPKEKHWTSQEEVELIAKKLELDGKSRKELAELRNAVVERYDFLMDLEIKEDAEGRCMRSDKFWTLNYGMMSVTAVIDIYKYMAGTPVYMI